MARSTDKPGKEVLYGDDLNDVLDELKKEMGGVKGLARQLAAGLKADGSNPASPYLRTRTQQAVLRLIEKGGRGSATEVLSDEDLDAEIQRDTVFYLTVMPAEQFEHVMGRVQTQRKMLAEREAKARRAADAALRPAKDQPNGGISPTVLAKTPDHPAGIPIS